MATDLSPTKAQILHSSQSGWSPLRIQKRSPSPTKLSPIPSSPPVKHADPSAKRTGSRRSSATFSHLRQHSLVSNSPFKSPDAAPEGAKYKPRPQSTFGYVLKSTSSDSAEGRPPSGLGISGAGLSPVLSEDAAPGVRKTSGGRRLQGVDEVENEDPFLQQQQHQLPLAAHVRSPSGTPGGGTKAAAFKPRKSRGLQELTQAQYVSRSPFLPDGDPASPQSGGMPRSVSMELPPPLPNKVQSVLPTPADEVDLQLHAEKTPPPTTTTTTVEVVHVHHVDKSPAKHHPSLNASPRRPALTSYRLHGPRTNSSATAHGQAPGQRRVSSSASRRRRRKNQRVTFDPRCDVVEFERDEGSEDGDEGEGEWTEGSEGEQWSEGGNSEAEVDGELREMERAEWEEGRLRVVNGDADDHEQEQDGLHGLVSQLVASPAPDALHARAPRPAHMPPPEFSDPDPDRLAPASGGLARETSIDRIERDVESILRDASLLMPASTPRADVHSFITASEVSRVDQGKEQWEGEGDMSAVSGLSTGTVEIREHERWEEHSFIHSQSMAQPPDLSTITPDTPGVPFSPEASFVSQASQLPQALHAPAGTPSTPPRKNRHTPNPVTPSTPPNRSPLPRDLAQDAEDGVPLGRTHHAARAAEAHQHQHQQEPQQPATIGGGLLPTPILPDMAPTSPFVFSPAMPQDASAAPGNAYSPRLTKEEVRARLALSRFGTPRTRARQGTPTSPGKPMPDVASPALTATTAHTHSTQSTPVPNMFSRGGPESPVPVEHAGPPGAREVEVVHREGTTVRTDKALPAPPGSGPREAAVERPELKSSENGSGSVVGVRSGLERLVEGVRQHASPARAGGSPKGSPSPGPGKARRVPVPPFAVDPGSPTKRSGDDQEEGEVEGTNSMEQREKEIIAKRRERRERERGFGLGEDEEESPRRLEVPQRRTGRRRSLSMGDVEEESKEDVEQEQEKKQNTLLPTPEIASDPFAVSVEREVRKYLDGPRSYHIREHEVKVFSSPADREKVSHIHGAGDVDRGKAWKVIRRSSDMNEYAREIRELRKSEKQGKALGKVFVRVVSVKGLNVPLPRQPAFFAVTLNNGIHAVTTPEAQLEKNAVIEQEFELIEHPKLEFTLTLKVRKDQHILDQLRPAMPVSLPSCESITTTKSTTPTQRSGFRAFFGSPKKSKQPPTRISPTPPMPRAQSEMPPVTQEDCLAKHLGPDGTLAQASISFKDIARRCDMRLFETAYPLMERSSSSAPDTVTGSSMAVTSPRAVGELVLQLFRLPPLPGIEQDALPQSLEECHRGLRHVAWHKALHHEGVLTQNGGDCSTWRRRRFRVVGAEMIASNDVTKKITATIDLTRATSLEDDQDPALKPAPGTGGMTRSMSSDDDLYSYTGVQRSFRVLFEEGDEIAFFADTDEEKVKMEVLMARIGRVPDHPLWAEMIWQRQEELSRQAAVAKSAAQRN
ncbi:hypothetical protein CALVIDRAFT_566091 [Calocera viscosa TUFC12733]|uniref:PH domain-containing protein n=1 Tax=Calocera viscosa (strain TUFC12733) TaxID=1330018 RepID=A0A167JSJ6_CALVF|nr:hypothetical protein CALVIDRAFT_566091 [Calocera viscosa TUFC12733]